MRLMQQPDIPPTGQDGVEKLESDLQEEREAERQLSRRGSGAPGHPTSGGGCQAATTAVCRSSGTGCAKPDSQYKFV